MNQENCDIIPTAPESPPSYEGYSNLGFVDSCPNLSYNPPSLPNSEQPAPNFKELIRNFRFWINMDSYSIKYS